MPYIVEWNDTPIYKNWVAEHGSDEGFMRESPMGWFPPFPLNTLMFDLMIVGIGNITAENAPEVFGRAAVYHKVIGSPFGRYKEHGEMHDVELTPQHVADCVGVSANVSTYDGANFGRTGWVKHMTKIARRELNPEVTEKDIKSMLAEYMKVFHVAAVSAVASKLREGVDTAAV